VPNAELKSYTSFTTGNTTYSTVLPLRTVSREDPATKKGAERFNSVPKTEILEVGGQKCFDIFRIRGIKECFPHHTGRPGISIFLIPLQTGLQNSLVLRCLDLRLVELPAYDALGLREPVLRFAAMGYLESCDLNVQHDPLDNIKRKNAGNDNVHIEPHYVN